jgi:hypothetical protein
MARAQSPIDTLPAWSVLNDLDYFDVRVANVPGRGLGLVTERNLSRQEDTFDIPILLRIPKKLVLSPEAVELYAKVDGNFKQLLDAAGHTVREFPSGDTYVSNSKSISRREEIFSCIY